MVEDVATTLFDRVLVVSFNAAFPKPEVTYTFPPPATQGKDGKDVKDSLADTVSEFCYPESHNELLAKFNSNNFASETFSFVLTDSLGGKTYGYCRRFRTDKDLECFCILSHIPSFSLFSQILDIVENRRKVSTTLVYSFLKTVLAQSFPAPGQTLSVKTFSTSKDGMDVYNLTRPADENLAAYVSFYNLFQLLELEDILKVWEYLLCERRVIICSKNLGTLSSCISALCALLYPFTWQHIFIPILPQSLIHFVTAPMPFLCGILSSSKSHLNGFPLDEVIMLDLDDKEFCLDHPFERVLPLPQFCTLKNNLRKLLRSGKKDKEFDRDVAKYFLLFFYTMFRDYKKYITPAKPLPPVPVQVVEEPNSKKKLVKRKPKGEFDRSSFIKSQNDESTQKFLELFGSSQMFETFILEREEMAVVGSASLPDCSFLILCSEKLNENEYTGIAECERCSKSVPLKHCCTYESYHFHPQCFECKKCHSTLVYDDFSAIVVQVNAAAQDPANKVRTVCASCENSANAQSGSGGSSGSGGGSAASFLKRMKHAVAKKMDLTSNSSSKRDEEKISKPGTPPLVNLSPPHTPQPVPRTPQQPDTDSEKRKSAALPDENDPSPKQSSPPAQENEGFFKSRFKSVQLHREPGLPHLNLASLMFNKDSNVKVESKIVPTKRRSKSDLMLPLNDRLKHQSKHSLDDNSLALAAKKYQQENEAKNRQTINLQEPAAKPPSSPKPLPHAPRPQRYKLVAPNPAIVNLSATDLPERPATAAPAPSQNLITKPRSGSGSGTPRSNFSEFSTPRSESSTPRSESATPRSESSTPRSNFATPRSEFSTSRSNLTEYATPRSESSTPRSEYLTPRSESSTPRANFSTPRSEPSTPRSESSTPRSESTTPRSNFTESPAAKPRSGSGQSTNAQTVQFTIPHGHPTNAPASGIALGKRRSGSVGRPSIAPSVSAAPSANGQPTNATSPVAKSSAATPVRPRSGSVGRPVPSHDLPVPSLMSQHRNKSPTPQTPSYKSALPGPNSQQPMSYKPAPPSKPQTKPKQLPVTPHVQSTPNNDRPKTPANGGPGAINSRPTSPFVSPVNVRPTSPINSTAQTTNKTNPSPTPVNANKLKPQPTAPTQPASRPIPSLVPTGPKMNSHPIPVLTKSKSVPDSRKSIVMDEPPSHKCTRCKKPFASPTDPPDTPYRIVSTNDAYYHPACFMCAHCGKTIETAYVTRDQNSYHRDCAASIAHTCSVCNKPILSQYLEFMGKIIHKECFTCVSCKEPLAKIGSKYVELDGNSYCLECTKNRPPK